MPQILRSLLRWAGVIVVVAIPLASPRHPPNFSDWAVYVTAGDKMAAGLTVYDVVGHYQFKYAPIVAAFFAGLLRCFDPHALARANWTAELLLFGVLLVALGAARQIREVSWKRYALLLAIVAALALPLRDELKLGQVNLWCLLLLYGSWLSSLRGHTRRAALFWTLAISLKLYALVLAPYWVFKRRWKFLAWVLVFHGLLNIGVVALWMGFSGAWDEHVAWLQTLTKSSIALVGSLYDVSLLGLFRKRQWDGGIFVWLLGFVACVHEAWRQSCLAEPPSSVRVASTLPQTAYFGRALAWVLLLNPLVWPYWYLFLIFLLIPGIERPAFFAGRISLPRRLWWIVYAALVVLIHRNNTPLALGGLLPGVLGLLLLTRPHQELREGRS